MRVRTARPSDLPRVGQLAAVILDRDLAAPSMPRRAGAAWAARSRSPRSRPGGRRASSS